MRCDAARHVATKANNKMRWVKKYGVVGLKCDSVG